MYECMSISLCVYVYMKVYKIVGFCTVFTNILRLSYPSPSLASSPLFHFLPFMISPVAFYQLCSPLPSPFQEHLESVLEASLLFGSIDNQVHFGL